MKTKLLFALLLYSLSAPIFLNAQVQAAINISSQPIWGPVGYNYVANYYIPEIESYYNVSSKNYMSKLDGKWITSQALLPRFSNYNLYIGYKVVINEPNPYLNFNNHRVKYISYWNKRNQASIRDSKDVKYFEIKSHPKHSEWKEHSNQSHGKKSLEKVKYSLGVKA